MNMMLLLTRGGKSAMLPIGLKLSPSLWDKKTRTVLRCRQKAFFDKVISDKYYAVQEIINKLVEENKELLNTKSIAEVKNMVQKELDGYKEEGEGVLLGKYFGTVAAKKTGSRKVSFDATWKAILRFDTNADELYLDDIKYGWIERFDAFMENEGLSVNTRWSYLSVLRSVFNNALDDGAISFDVFRKYKIRKEPTIKRSLPAKAIAEFANMELEGMKCKYRDIAMLSFYLIGINMADLLNLTRDNVEGGRIVYIRKKTKKMYSIRIEPEARRILDKYKGNRYLLDVLDVEGSSVHKFTKNMNINLKKIGNVVVGDDGKKRIVSFFDRLSSYYMRHSWATIAYNDCNIPVDVISQALGHSMGNKVTMVYINTDYKKVDEANRRVIDKIKAPTQPPRGEAGWGIGQMGRIRQITIWGEQRG